MRGRTINHGRKVQPLKEVGRTELYYRPAVSTMEKSWFIESNPGDQAVGDAIKTTDLTGS